MHTPLYLLFGLLAALPSQNRKIPYQVHATCLLTNFVRFNTKEYNQQFGTNATRHSCAVKSPKAGPVQMTDSLSKAAWFQVDSMIAYGNVTHDTGKCPKGYKGKDKCGFLDRMLYFFPDGKVFTENVAKGNMFQDPIQLTNAWINCEGHCKNLMAQSLDLVGIAVDQTKDRMVYGSQEFTTNPGIVKKKCMSCGSHILQNEKPLFMVATSKLPKDATVNLVINGELIEMKKSYGSDQNWIYKIEDVDLNEDCNDYYFSLNQQDGTEIERYPENNLKTEGYGTCRALF